MTELSSDEAAETLVRLVTDRLEESVARHMRLDPLARRDRLIDLAAKFEKQRFDRPVDKADREGRETEAEVWELMRDDVLPAIVHDLRRRH